MDLETLRQEYPTSQGWDLIPLGNRFIAVNRWGGAQKIAYRKSLLPEGAIHVPESWCYKQRAK